MSTEVEKNIKGSKHIFSPIIRLIIWGFVSSSLVISATLPLQAYGERQRKTVEVENPSFKLTAIAVGNLLETGHYAQQRLSKNVSRKFLQTYLEFLDYNHLYFTQKDVDSLNKKYGDSLAEGVINGETYPAKEIFSLFAKKMEKRVEKIKEFLKTPVELNGTGVVERNRQKANWPKSEEDADKLWKEKLTNEVLQEHLKAMYPSSEKKTVDKADEKKKDEKLSDQQIAQTIANRYSKMSRYANRILTDDATEQVDQFLNALAQTFDPHSEFLGKEDMKNFSINMQLSLVGIGAVLKTDDGGAKVDSVVPGGPAQLDGRLKPGDKITAVAQGNKDYVEVDDTQLVKVVEMIRGEKGTKVRLQILPVDATDPAQRKEIELVREEIKLKDQEASADIISRKDKEGKERKIGFLTLPSFYSDMGKTKKTSVTQDVKLLLSRLRKEKIKGLVIDLRKNGGGSLEEAVSLTGLFIKKGPVVQTKSYNGKVDTYCSSDESPMYSGPLVILISRQSASASEIFAGALQDYGRAVIVGDSKSFGKGTVQTLLPINRFTAILGKPRKDSPTDETLKLTVQKFYRISGGSTQLKGVISDISLPSLSDLGQTGEDSLKNRLPYDEIKKVPYAKWNHPLFLKELRANSNERVNGDREFQFVTEDMITLNNKAEENKISLNQDARKKEIDEFNKKKLEREKERSLNVTKGKEETRYHLAVEGVETPTLELLKGDPTSKKLASTSSALSASTGSDGDSLDGDAKGVDPQQGESLNILEDLINLSGKAGGDDVKENSVVGS